MAKQAEATAARRLMCLMAKQNRLRRGSLCRRHCKPMLPVSPVKRKAMAIKLACMKPGGGERRTTSTVSLHPAIFSIAHYYALRRLRAGGITRHTTPRAWPALLYS